MDLITYLYIYSNTYDYDCTYMLIITYSNTYVYVGALTASYGYVFMCYVYMLNISRLPCYLAYSFLYASLYHSYYIIY